MKLEEYFSQFRRNIIGQEQFYTTPYGRVRLVYADWIASGRLYKPVEDVLLQNIAPFIGNTHTETSETGRLMTQAYKYSQVLLKRHVGANEEDVLLSTGFGMTSAIVKFQRIIGLKTCALVSKNQCLKDSERPVVFITHMEHHSNQTTWYETYADVVVIEPGKDLLVDLNHLEDELKRYRNRKRKIGSFTACSNVTGIYTPYHDMAKLMHMYGGLAFIDFAASAPYESINMHTADPLEQLDAIFFSPHKFLGGPGSSGILVFDSKLYDNKVPDQPGGGTVDWTNPWGEYKFIDNIEIREDGGTPGFLQTMRAALSMELKYAMGVENMNKRESELTKLVFDKLSNIPDLHILADNIRDRLGVISFYITGIHYHLIVTLLSDRFGIQVRGGCACAGTYGHYLLNVSHEKSKAITGKINAGDLSEKPGWVRLSLHPTMTDSDLCYITDAIAQIRKNYHVWGHDYDYNRSTNEFRNRKNNQSSIQVESWFNLI